MRFRGIRRLISNEHLFCQLNWSWQKQTVMQITPKAKTVNKFLRPGLHTLFLNKQNGLAKQNVVLLKVLKIGASICLFFFFFFKIRFLAVTRKCCCMGCVHATVCFATLFQYMSGSAPADWEKLRLFVWSVNAWKSSVYEPCLIFISKKILFFRVSLWYRFSKFKSLLMC